MSPVFSDITIDSPAPEVAHADAEKYFQWLMPAWEQARVHYSPDELADDLLSGKVLLVRVWKDKKFSALAAAKVDETMDGRELHIMALAGEGIGEWLKPLADTFDQLATEAECIAIRLDGRKGWQTALRGEGYKVHQVTMRKQTMRKGNGQSRIQ